MAEHPEDQQRAGVSLARYAEISAELRTLGRARAAEVLARAGVRADDWEKADAAWKAAIDGDLDGKAGLLLAFAACFSKARKLLAREPVSVSDSAVSVEEVGVPASKAEVRVPTFLHTPPLGAPTPVPAVASSPRPFAATADLDVHTLVSAILPFDPGKSTPSAPESVKPASPGSLGGTAELDVHRIASRVLAFDPASAPATHPEPREPVRGPAALGRTADLDVHHLVSAIMPFGARDAPLPGPSRPATAGPPAQAPELPELTLEQYASLAAEIAAAPLHAAATRAKYGVPSEQAHHALNALWDRRFAEDRAQHERWARLVAEYRAWLRQCR